MFVYSDKLQRFVNESQLSLLPDMTPKLVVFPAFLTP